jgi:GDPmannose 4,6-dehydratase
VGISVLFSGENENETGTVSDVNKEIFTAKVGKEYLNNFLTRLTENPVVVRVDKRYYRPTEVDLLLGDPSKARSILGWKPEYDLDGLIDDMITSDLILMKKEAYLRKGGYTILNYFE